MSGIKALKAKVQEHPVYGTPQRIYDIHARPSAAEPREIVEDMLKKLAKDLEIKPDLSQIRFDKVNKTVLGSHVLFQQHHRGLQISGAWVKVDIDREGRVVSILNDLVPEKLLLEAEHKESKSSTVRTQMTTDEAERSAIAEINPDSNSANSLAESELVYYPYRGVPTRAWKLVIKTTSPLGEWKVYVDAYAGAVLFLQNQLKMQDGRGKIFNPNPVVALEDDSLTAKSRIPKSAYLDVVLPDLDGKGRLDGPFVTTRITSRRVKRKNLRFMFGRTNPAFKEVMAYYHIDRVQRYVQELGFDNILNRPVQVDVAGIADDNSFYSPADKTITFGTGGVGDAEDAEIIVHEYGHAIQDDQVPGFGQGDEAGAMGEGFGDYLAASFFEEFKPEKFKDAVASWDAVAYSGEEIPSLRRLDSNKKYPKDFTYDIHTDGEIWSACLWEMRSRLGRKKADRLAIAHHFLLSRSSKFEDAANAVLQTDKMMNKGRNERALRKIFVKRGIFPNPKRNNARAGDRFSDSPSGVRGK
jgi:Zn-dependent metalloprotease